MKPDAKSPLKKSLPLIGIVFAAVLLYVLFGDYLTFAALAENREALIAWRDSNYLLAALTYVLIYIAVVGFSIPGAVFLSLGGGFLFGALTGTLLTVVGATIGATAIFLAAKTGLGNALQARLERNGEARLERNGEGRLARMQAGLKENEISYLFLMRLVPAVPFWFANLAPAFLGVGLRNFVLTTFIGIIPGTAVYLWVGSGLGEVFARGDTPDLGIIFEWQILGPILALSALSALPILLKVFRKTGVEA